jgi:Ca2+-binding EF-hand superfamily protein
MHRNTLFAALVVLAAPLALAAPDDGPRMGPGPHMRKVDANQDGAVTRAEALADRAAWFAKMDGDKDGFITSAEIDAAGERARQERQERRLARLDTNKDGKVSKAEFDAAPSPMFERLDTDKNGAVDRDELSAARERHHRRRPQH